MGKSITVSYSFRDVLVNIGLTYNIQKNGEIQTIACSVDGTILPQWLQLSKFEIMSSYDHGKYTPLFNEIIYGKNMDTVLFIDKVYLEIMVKEKMKVLAFANN